MNIVRLFAFLGRLLGFVIALILCVPVILLPPATAVPAWVWAPLAAANVALLVLFFRLQPAWKGAAVSLAGLLLVGIAAVVLSQAFARTPAIAGADGKPLSTSAMPLPAPPACTSKVTSGLSLWYSSAQIVIIGKRAKAPETRIRAPSPPGRAAGAPCPHAASARSGGSSQHRRNRSADRERILASLSLARRTGELPGDLSGCWPVPGQSKIRNPKPKTPTRLAAPQSAPARPRGG